MPLTNKRQNQKRKSDEVQLVAEISRYGETMVRAYLIHIQGASELSRTTWSTGGPAVANIGCVG